MVICIYALITIVMAMSQMRTILYEQFVSPQEKLTNNSMSIYVGWLD